MTKKFQTRIVYVLFLLGLTFLLLFCQAKAFANDINDINVSLMKSTFKITGKSKQDPMKFSVGTMFVVGRPLKSKPQASYYVMVTAAHVLDDIIGDEATILLRKKESDGTYKKVSSTIKIRENGVPLFVHHASADVVAMYLQIPNDLGFSLLPINLLYTQSG